MEAFLGLVAFFLSFLVLPPIICDDWDIETRTKLFTFFGIVGLMGLSVGIKRNELMERERSNYREDKELQRNNRLVEKSHELIFNVNSEHQHIHLFAIHELEKLHKSEDFPQAYKRQIEIAIAAYIVSYPPQEQKTIGTSNRDKALKKLFYMLDSNQKNVAITIFDTNAFEKEKVTGSFPTHCASVYLPNETTSLQDLLIQESSNHAVSNP